MCIIAPCDFKVRHSYEKHSLFVTQTEILESRCCVCFCYTLMLKICVTTIVNIDNIKWCILFNSTTLLCGPMCSVIVNSQPTSTAVLILTTQLAVRQHTVVSADRISSTEVFNRYTLSAITTNLVFFAHAGTWNAAQTDERVSTHRFTWPTGCNISRDSAR